MVDHHIQRHGVYLVVWSTAAKQLVAALARPNFATLQVLIYLLLLSVCVCSLVVKDVKEGDSGVIGCFLCFQQPRLTQH